MPSPFPNFTRELNTYCRQHGARVEPVRVAGRWSNHVLRLRPSSGKIFSLYVKVSNISNPWWGINENRVKDLNRSGEWYLILLWGDAGESHLLPGPLVTSGTQDGTWSLQAPKGEYKVHHHELGRFPHFKTFANLFDYLASVPKLTDREKEEPQAL
jgi:hypothetical protein